MASTEVPAVDRAMLILDYLAKGPAEGATLASIHRDLGLNKSTAHSILVSLQKGGFVRRQGREGLWNLGLRLFELGSVSRRRDRDFDRFEQVASQVRSACKESVYYAVLRGTQVVYLDIVAEKSHSLTVSVEPGDSIPAHCSSMGKVLLSDFDDDRIRSLYENVRMERKTGKSIGEVDTLISEVRTAREAGYAFNNEENENGVCSVSAPVRASSGEMKGRVVAAIGVAVPASRMDLERRAGLVRLLVDAAEKLGSE